MINLRTIFRLLSALLYIVSFFLIGPMVAALNFGEIGALIAFFITLLIFIFTGISIQIIVGKRKENEVMSTKSGLIFVSLSWLTISLLGSVPFILVGGVGFIDAFFETASGFTTTGASIYDNVEILPKALLLWRGMTNWLGGMGIVVLTVALMPFLSIDGVRLVKAEAPGHDPEHLSFHMTRTAKYLWFIYLFLTFAQFSLLVLFKMPSFEAICYSLSTLSTGGFAPRNDSVMSQSIVLQSIMTVFMFLGGVNFSLYFWLLKGRPKVFSTDTEFKAYLLIFCILSLSSAIVLWKNPDYTSFLVALHHSTFQIASILTTTGFVISDYEIWPPLAVVFIFIAMACGGSMGSTSGGMKVGRIVALIKQIGADLKSAIYPNAYFRSRMNGHFISNPFLAHVSGYMACYIIVLFVLTMIMASANIPVMDSFFTSISALGNIGPSFGALGPMETYSSLPNYVKIALGLGMIVGRLEIFTVFAIFIPIFWRRWGD
ncbi:MAG: TrkH family potassium uptake protein [Spirochaetia bacterium]